VLKQMVEKNRGLADKEIRLSKLKPAPSSFGGRKTFTGQTVI